MENLPPPNNDLNIPEDEHAPAPEHDPIAPNPAHIQPSDYLANAQADPKEEPEEEEKPIPKQALAAPVGFLLNGLDEEEIEDEEMEVKDNDGENDDAEVYNPYEEADPFNSLPPSPETAEREIINAPGSSTTIFNLALCKVYPHGPMVNDLNALYSRVKTLTKQMWDRFIVESSSSKRLERNDMRMDNFDDDMTALDSSFREQMQEMKKLVAGLNEQF
ncbi:hypothetical protein Tco_1521492 [Tanacetum coccineum]